LNAAKLKLIEPYKAMRGYLETSHIGRQAEGGVDALRDRIAAEGDGRIVPVRVPWQCFNQSLGYGLTPGQVTIIAGSAGVAKSYLLLNLLRHAGETGFRWRLLPLEDDAGRWIQRMLAVHLASWAMVAQPEDDREETRQQVAARKLAALENNKELVVQWYENIFENPRLPVADASGAMVARDVHYRDVLAFLEGTADACDLVGLDCLSQISFSDDGRDFIGQSEFMRGVVGIAASTGAHIVLVGHNGKGGVNRDPLDAVQGSALFNRLAHNVIVLARNDPPIESEVLSRINPLVEHRLTLSILKSRGGMSGDKIAMDLDPNAPRFIEHGKIRAKAKGRR
jgi:hypothetical protein